MLRQTLDSSFCRVSTPFFATKYSFFSFLSTRFTYFCTAPNSTISAIFNENFEIGERCEGVHCVDLGESFPTSIYLQNLASIQPRTSSPKFAEASKRYPPPVTNLALLTRRRRPLGDAAPSPSDASSEPSLSDSSESAAAPRSSFARCDSRHRCFRLLLLLF